jgi:hypothetical protein
MRIPVHIYVKIKFSVLDDIDNIKKNRFISFSALHRKVIFTGIKVH